MRNDTAVKLPTYQVGNPSPGSAGLLSQCYGAVTVSAVASATGGVGGNNIIQPSKK